MKWALKKSWALRSREGGCLGQHSISKGKEMYNLGMMAKSFWLSSNEGSRESVGFSQFAEGFEHQVKSDESDACVSCGRWSWG